MIGKVMWLSDAIAKGLSVCRIQTIPVFDMVYNLLVQMITPQWSWKIVRITREHEPVELTGPKTGKKMLQEVKVSIVCDNWQLAVNSLRAVGTSCSFSVPKIILHYNIHVFSYKNGIELR